VTTNTFSTTLHSITDKENQDETLNGHKLEHYINYHDKIKQNITLKTISNVNQVI